MAAILTRLSELKNSGRVFLLFLCAGVCFLGQGGVSYADNLPPYPATSRDSGTYQSRVFGNTFGLSERYSPSGIPYDLSVSDPFVRDSYIRRSRGLPYAYNELDHRISPTLPYRPQNSLSRNDRWSGASSDRRDFYLQPESYITGSIYDSSASALYSSQRKPFSLNDSELASRLAKQSDRASKDVLRYDNTEFENPLEDRMNLLDSTDRKLHVKTLQENSDKDVPLNIKDVLSDRSDQIQAEKMQKVLTPEGFRVWLEVQVEEKKRLEKELNVSKSAETEDRTDDPEETDADSEDSKEEDESESVAEITKKITYEQALAADRKYEEFEILADANFDKYTMLGQTFLKEGLYYEARNAFEMASIWSDKKSAAIAGKGFAHFAVGEYMSSATHLMWAIECSDKFLENKIDIAGVIGSDELFDKRIEELKTLYQTTGFYRSAFLLAYISYQDGEFENAAEYIDIAKETLGQTDAFKALKKAIDNGLEIDSRE